MSTPRGPAPARRTQLSRDSVLRGAVAVADAGGLGSLTIRSLARELDVKPMSLYHYVSGKEQILDGIVDLVFGEIGVPSPDGDWRTEMYRRAHSVRLALRRHPWAVGLLESRPDPGPANLRFHEATVATLRRAGFPVATTAHANALLDSYVYGFAVQEGGLPGAGDDTAAVTESIMERFDEGQYPYLVEIATEHVLKPGYAFDDDFEFGLTLILDALAGQLPR